METETKIEWVHCNECLRKTKHRVVAERINEDSQIEGEYSMSWRTTYTMFQCNGCENVTMRRKFWFSEWDEIEIEFYPPPVSRKLPEWHEELSKDYRELLKEVYLALHADSRRLSMMGARALVDMFMNDKVGDIGGFVKKLSELERKGYLSTLNKDILNAALEVGHAAAHRGHKPTKKQVSQVIDIVEHLIQSYVLEEAAKELETSTPKRLFSG